MNDQNQKQESDELDRLLSAWHDENQEAARAGRDRMLDAVSAENPSVVGRIDADSARTPAPWRSSSLVPGRGMLAAALFIVVAMLAVLLIPDPQRAAFAQVVQVPEGGRQSLRRPARGGLHLPDVQPRGGASDDDDRRRSGWQRTDRPR